MTEEKTREELETVMPGLEVVERCSVERAVERMDEVVESGT